MHDSPFLRKTAAALAAVLLLLPATSLAQETTPQPAPTYSTYRTLIETAKEQGKARDISLADCIEMALKRNLDIQMSRYQPLIQTESLKAALGVYDFGVTGSTGYGKTQRPIMDAVSRRVLNTSTSNIDSYSFTAGISRYLSTGGTVSVSLDNSRTSSNTSFASPNFGGSIGVDFSQPLWRGFKIDQNRHSILIARKDRAISDITFENMVASTVKTVEDTYWDLVNSIEQQKIQLQSREIALIQLRDNQKRVEVGTLAPIVITQTRAEVAQWEQSVIDAEAAIIQKENALKNLIANDPKDEVWGQMLIPHDTPTIPEKIMAPDEAFTTALRQRPEVRSLNLNLEKDDIDIKFAKDSTKPKLDLVASYSTNGSSSPNYRETMLDANGNPVLDPNGDPIKVDGPFTGGMGTTWEQMLKHDYKNYSFKVNFEYTLGNHAAKAKLASARLGRAKDEADLRKTMQTIRVDVQNALQGIEVNRKSLEAAAAARQYQEEQLDGQNKRFQAGLTTNFEVLQAQRDLAKARATELQSRISLRKAVTSLLSATFTHLQQNQLEIARNQ